MELSINSFLIGLAGSFIMLLAGVFIKGYFESRDKKQDRFENFKDQAIGDISSLSTKIDVLSDKLSETNGKVQQNTEIITKQVALLDHISRQLKRLFEHNGLRSIKEVKD